MAEAEISSAEATVGSNGGLAMTKEMETNVVSIDPIGSDSHDQATTSLPSLKYDRDGKSKDEEEDKQKKNMESSRNLSLYRAAFRGDWSSVGEILQYPTDADAVTAKITRRDETVLHIAAGSYYARGFFYKFSGLNRAFVSKALELTDKSGATPLVSAAVTGYAGNSSLLMDINPNLVTMPDNSGYYPIHHAAKYGHRRTTGVIFDKTIGTDSRPFTGKSGVRLLNLLIAADMYELAFRLMCEQPELVLGRDDDGQTAFETLAKRPLAFESGSQFGYWQHFFYHLLPGHEASFLHKRNESGDVENPTKSSEKRSSKCHRFLHQISTTFILSKLWLKMKIMFRMLIAPCVKDIREVKQKHCRALEVVHLMCEQVANLGGIEAWELLEKPLRTAARFGIHELVTEILRTYPDLIWSCDKDNRYSLFHIAVLNRRPKIFCLIHQMGSRKHPAAESKDKEQNNILHLAGMLGPSTQVSGAALQMQREMQWFKEVEKCVQPSYKDEINKHEKTPRMVFTEAHKELVEKGERWMKDTASSCSVVAALIVTVMFAATFTVPGGNISDRGTPIFLKEISFKVFAVSDAIGLFSSSTSVLMFLGIVTSRYSEEDFLVSLPKKLIIGLITLFISIAAMVAAFSAAFYIVLFEQWKWVPIPIAMLACFPVTLFVRLQFPLLVDIYYSTYRHRIFHVENRDIDNARIVFHLSNPPSSNSPINFPSQA